MAKEIQATATTAFTLYAIMRSAVGTVVKVSDGTLVTYATADIANYVITLTEQGTASGVYTGDVPAGVAAGVYGVIAYKRVGGSPAEGDTVMAAGNIEWLGTAVLKPGDVNTIKTQAVTCAASVTVGAFVGNATAALSVNASGRVDLGLWLGVAPLALASQYVQADAKAVNASTAAAALMGIMYAGFETGTAQAGAASSITLRSGASAVNSQFVDQAIYIISGDGAGETNRITSYNGTSKVAGVETAWVTQPSSNSVYVVLGRIG